MPTFASAVARHASATRARRRFRRDAPRCASFVSPIALTASTALVSQAMGREVEVSTAFNGSSGGESSPVTTAAVAITLEVVALLPTSTDACALRAPAARASAFRLNAASARFRRAVLSNTPTIRRAVAGRESVISFRSFAAGALEAAARSRFPQRTAEPPAVGHVAAGGRGAAAVRCERDTGSTAPLGGSLPNRAGGGASSSAERKSSSARDTPFAARQPTMQRASNRRRKCARAAPLQCRSAAVSAARVVQRCSAAWSTRSTTARGGRVIGNARSALLGADALQRRDVRFGVESECKNHAANAAPTRARR